MKILLLIILFISIFFASEAQQRKAVIIIVDGVPTDVIERLKVPSICEIAKKGAFGHSYVGGAVGSYSETPTISAVGYETMLTGTWVNKHNVYGNSHLKPGYNYWTIFQIAKAQKRLVTTGIFSSWTDNRTVLLGEGKPETNHLQLDYVYDGLEFDTVHFPHKKSDLHIFDYDEAVSYMAAKCISQNAPELSWVYLWYTDDAGHQYGNSPEFDMSVYDAGIQIDRIWKAVQYREKNFDEEWMIVVMTDHGRTADGYHHGKQSWRERCTWIATNRKPNKRFLNGESAVVDVNPTICEWLNFEVPQLVRMERDGISFIGKTEIKNMTLTRYADEVTIHWESVKGSAPVTIYVAVSNEYPKTASEQWKKLTTIKASADNYKVKLSELGNKSAFYKFCLLSPHDALNMWLKN